MQLLTYVLPAFEQLKKEGEGGRRKITQYTRCSSGLALFQSLGIALALEEFGRSRDQPWLWIPPHGNFHADRRPCF